MKTMRVIVSCFLIVVLILWIIPMGAFIEIAKEGLLCGGKRAVCLCSKNFKKVNYQKDGERFTQASVRIHQTTNTGNSSSNNLFFEFTGENNFLKNSSYPVQKSLANFYPNLFVKSIEHVPKA